LDKLGRKEIREFLDWVHADAASEQGTNPGRTSTKVRSHLRAVFSRAWEQDMVDALPRFPKIKPQRDVAGRYYLTKSEINALYFATDRMTRPKGWTNPLPIGRYSKCALVVFFDYGVDTRTIWKTESFNEPILWRHVSWDRHSADREVKEQLRNTGNTAKHGDTTLLCAVSISCPSTRDIFDTDSSRNWSCLSISIKIIRNYRRQTPLPAFPQEITF